MYRAIALSLLLASVVSPAAALPICQGGFRHDCVVDGDTLWIGRTKIRIENLNAPEVGEHAHCALELQRGEAAKQHLAKLTDRGAVTFVPTGKMTYDRVLARVYVGGHDVGEMMVRDGYALPWRKQPPYPDWCSRTP